MNYVLTLVHGTWADTKGWVAPGSFLRQELEGRLRNVAFREFSWTSTNTHAARAEAGNHLAQFIRAGQAEHPDARHFLIAHSHGGNVALYAMRDPAAREVVSGIASLGTPFISARCRDPRRHADVIAWLILLVAALALFVVLDALNLLRFAAAWFIGAVVLIVTMKPRLSRWLTDTTTREQADVVASVQPPSIDRSKLLILCARGDEAGRWLRTWDIVAKAPFAIAFLLLAIVEGTARFNLPVVIDGLARSTLHSGLDQIRLFGFDGWSLTSGVIVLCVIWGVVVLGSGVVRWPGYWREPLLSNVLVEIGTDRVPQAVDGDRHSAYTFDVPPQSMRSRITREHLRHSAICDHPSVVSAIADWIGLGLMPSSKPRERSAEPYGAAQNRLDPNTSASAADQRAVPKHSLRFCFGHTVPHCEAPPGSPER